MYFKGDIIITDPCYVMKETEDKRPEDFYRNMPRWEDYVTHPLPREYPDAVIKEASELTEDDLDVIKCIHETNDILKLMGVPLHPEVVYRSATRDREVEEYTRLYHLYKEPYLDDWEKSAYGENLQALGFVNCLSQDTLYGDWSCTVFNSDNKEELGDFCADAGMVAVFLLDEVLKYNPDFDYHTERPWTTTLIKDFDGDIEIKEINNGDKTEVRVIGKGNINFESTQSGF